MVVLEKICREVEAPYAAVTAAVSACDRNLVGGTRAARSAAGETLGDEVPGGYIDFHETAAFIQPDIDRSLAPDPDPARRECATVGADQRRRTAGLRASYRCSLRG